VSPEAQLSSLSGLLVHRPVLLLTLLLLLLLLLPFLLLLHNRSVSPEAQLSSLFGLAADEALVESYSCSLMQSYACSHNSLTPPMQVRLLQLLWFCNEDMVI
jgi:ABC-type sulfate transport system permease component